MTGGGGDIRQTQFSAGILGGFQEKLGQHEGKSYAAWAFWHFSNKL
jgi:hypothetical protein